MIRRVLTVLLCLASILCADVTENFETGGFLNNNFEFAGDIPWFIAEDEVGEGVYSAKSGIIQDSQTSVMTLALNYTEAGTISFDRKVSSEPSGVSFYDGLRFIVDNDTVAEWGGEFDWENVSFDVEPGLHVFKWSYEKDYTTANGDDCAWIDNIVAGGGEVPADNEGPEFIEAYGTEADFDSEMNFSVLLREATGIKSVKAYYKIGSNEEIEVEMEELCKSRRYYTYRALFPAQTYTHSILEEVHGSVRLEMTDNNDIVSTAEGIFIKWYNFPYIMYSESFESEMPSDWNIVDIEGTEGEWTVGAEAVSPEGMLPQDGSRLAMFNSYTSEPGSKTRLETKSYFMGLKARRSLRFYFFHSLGNTWANDSLAVQYSLDDGSTWEDLGHILRYNGTTNQWVEYTFELDSILELSGMPEVKFGFLGCSQRGRDLNIDNIRIYGIDTDGMDLNSVPHGFTLLENYPNPFNPSTSIRYYIPSHGHVSIKVYDVMGREVADLVNRDMPSGFHNAGFDASNLSSGQYFYHLKSGEVNMTRKMLLLK